MKERSRYCVFFSFFSTKRVEDRQLVETSEPVSRDRDGCWVWMV